MPKASDAPAQYSSPFAILSNRGFRLMWLGQLISTAGSALTSLAASIYVYRNTGGSALSVSLMLIATAAPSMLVGLVAGVYVDRYDHKKIMLAADLSRMLLVALIPLLVQFSVAWLYVIVALLSAIGQFYEPAHESVLPEVASESELAAANSLMAISSFGATAIGFAASGLIAAQANIAWAFYLDALTFLVSALCLLPVHIRPAPPAEKTTVALVAHNLQDGVRYLVRTPILRSMFLASILTLVGFGLSNALLLPFSVRALGANEFQYSLQEAFTSLGFVVGSLLLASLFNRLREGPWIAISYIGMALFGIVYAFLSSIPVALLVVVLTGFLNAPAVVARRVILQRHTPRDLRGRVISAFAVSRDLLFLVGMAAAGLADIVDVRLMYFASGVLILAAGIWALVLPGLRQESAEWKKALSLLRAAPAAPALGGGQAVSLAELDQLIGLLPAMGRLDGRQRQALLDDGRIVQAPAGTAIVSYGEGGDAAYFVLAGRAVAGLAEPDGSYRSLSSMAAGDFFGEIAALTGARRTANVVAESEMRLLQVPGATLRSLMANSAISQLLLSAMTERLNRTTLAELPRFAGHNQTALRALRGATDGPLGAGSPAAEVDA